MCHCNNPKRNIPNFEFRSVKVIYLNLEFLLNQMNCLFSCFKGLSSDQDRDLLGYEPIRKLGKGVCGSVILAKSPEGLSCAVKSCQLSSPLWMLQMQQRECEALCVVGGRHVNLVEPVECRLSGTSVQLVLKACAGGTLESYCKQHRMSEDMACYMVKQLLSVVQHLHAREIAYRDIKLQNILLAERSSSRPPQLVLCDLGTAKSWQGKSPVMATFVGTPGFMSPQVLASMFNNSVRAGAPAASDDSSNHSSASHSSHTYDATKADVWAIGALLHYMLHQHLPYGYDSFAPLLPPQQALMTLYHLENERNWREAAGTSGLRKISKEAQDLLDKMLMPDEEQRISMAEVQAHPWINRHLPGHLQQSLDALQQQQQQLDAAARGCRTRCKQLARQAVDLLFELSRSTRLQQVLQQEQRCLSVPLSLLGMQLSASAQNSEPDEQQVVQQMEAVLQQLQREALGVGLAAGCSSSNSPRLRLSAASASAQQHEHSQLTPQQQLSRSASGKCSDDTCFLLQASSSDRHSKGHPGALLQVQA